MVNVTRPELTSPMILKYGTREVIHQHGQFARQVRAALGVDLWLPKMPRAIAQSMTVSSVRRDSVATRALRLDSVASKIDDFVTANVSAIKSLGDQPLGQVEKLVLQAFGSGMRYETLAKEILRRFDVAKSSARLIARSQLGRLNAQVAMERQRELGIKQWIWMTVVDERVRKTHRALHGQIYDYDPEGRQPPFAVGSEPNCRCSPHPVFADVMAALGAFDSDQPDPGEADPRRALFSVPIGLPPGLNPNVYKPGFKLPPSDVPIPGFDVDRARQARGIPKPPKLARPVKAARPAVIPQTKVKQQAKAPGLVNFRTGGSSVDEE